MHTPLHLAAIFFRIARISTYTKVAIATATLRSNEELPRKQAPHLQEALRFGKNMERFKLST